MREEDFQHYQPHDAGAPEEEAEEVLNRITQKEHPLTDAEKEALRRGGYGELIEDIERHQKDETLPPWMH